MRSISFFLERGLGSASYCFLVFIATKALEETKSQKRISLVLNITLAVLCVMGFFYVPAETADLYRWRTITSGWAAYSFREFFATFLMNTSSPVAYLLIYACGKTGIDGLLPAICTFIFYNNLFHIIKKTSIVFEANGSTTATTFLFLMCTGRFVEVISGVRCMVAFSIVAKSIFDEIYGGKSIIRSAFWYLLACLIHTAAIPLVAIRLVVLLVEREQKIWKRMINLTSVVIIVFFSIKFGDLYIGDALNRASGYIENDIYSYGWEYLIVGIHLVIIYDILVRYYRHYKKDSTTDSRSIARVTLFATVFATILFSSYSIFHRFLGFSSFLIIPLVCFVLMKKSIFSISYIKNIKTICYLILVIAALRGNLCAYKFFQL